ncbi:MAG: DMT family transporter [Thaumarchaeota archaeon]|jgi:drug/metabolite transporter (DMT)-like permease|nr:DMT family transporter [Candidatus Geocrenenecus arthurdayi]
MVKKFSYLTPVLTGILWGSTAPVSKLILYDISPWDLVVYRVLIGSFTLMLLVRMVGVSESPRVSLRDLLILSLSGIAVPWLAYNLGLLYVNANHAGLMLGSYPLMTFLIAYFLVGEKLVKLQYAGISVGFIGLIVFFLDKITLEYSFQWLIGALLIMFSIFCWSVYAAYLKKIELTGGSLTLTLKTFIVSIPILTVPVLLIQQGINLPREPSSLIGVIWLGVFPSAVSYYLFNIGSEDVSATIMATSGLLIPIVSSILAYFMLFESFKLIEVMGAVLVIVGLSIAYLKG